MSQERRTDDMVVTLLADRIDTVERASAVTTSGLERHITECSLLQKRVLVVCVVILTWLVGHSPEAAKIAGVVFKVME